MPTLDGVEGTSLVGESEHCESSGEDSCSLFFMERKPAFFFGELAMK
jgi:hypothetical protein